MAGGRGQKPCQKQKEDRAIWRDRPPPPLCGLLDGSFGSLSHFQGVEGFQPGVRWGDGERTGLRSVDETGSPGWAEGMGEAPSGSPHPSPLPQMERRSQSVGFTEPTSPPPPWCREGLGTGDTKPVRRGPEITREEAQGVRELRGRDCARPDHVARAVKVKGPNETGGEPPA